MQYGFLIGKPLNKAIIQTLMDILNKRRSKGNKVSHFVFMRSSETIIDNINNLLRYVPEVDIGNIDMDFDTRTTRYGFQVPYEKFDVVPAKFRNELLSLQLFNRRNGEIGDFITELQIKLIDGKLVHACEIGSFLFFTKIPKRKDYE